MDVKLICTTPDLSKYVGRLETRLKMSIMIEEDDYYWTEWAREQPYYLMVFQDPDFESFNTTDKREVHSDEKLLRINVRVIETISILD